MLGSERVCRIFRTWIRSQWREWQSAEQMDGGPQMYHHRFHIGKQHEPILLDVVSVCVFQDRPCYDTIAGIDHTESLFHVHR